MKIKEWMKESGISQRELARLIGRSSSRVCRLVKHGKKPTDSEMAVIVKVSKGKVAPADFYAVSVTQTAKTQLKESPCQP